MFYFYNRTPKVHVQKVVLHPQAQKLKQFSKNDNVTYTQSAKRNIASVEATLIDPETKAVEYKMKIPKGMHLYDEEKMKEIASDYPIDQINREDE
jgi:hypothetical protein